MWNSYLMRLSVHAELQNVKDIFLLFLSSSYACKDAKIARIAYIFLIRMFLS